jgi:hypothetical protein
MAIIQPEPLAISEMAEVYVRAINGSHINITGYFGNKPVNLTFNHTTLTGSFKISIGPDLGPGTYNLSIVSNNLVTATLYDYSSLEADYK